MTDNNFLFNFSNSSNTVSNNTKLTTLPPQNCINGSPVDQYAGTGIYSWEVLYSLWTNYQSTDGALFTTQQVLKHAPDTSNTTGPANIFIIRHGEKTSGSHCLNNNGIYRACKIVDFVNNLARDGYPISYIVSCNGCPYDTVSPSMRELQTIMPASFMLNIPLFVYGGAFDFDAVLTQLFGNNQYNGLNVLICWEHASIQQLCLNLLNTAASLNPSRLPNNIITGDAFFNSIDACPDGNYLCNDQTNTDYYLNPINLPSGVGANSQTYPYWQNKNFNNVFWFNSSASTNYIFDFKIFTEGDTCLTCVSSCELLIGLYQPLAPRCISSYNYYNKTPDSENLENKCEVPEDWVV